MKQTSFFTKALMHWHGNDNFRSLPWKQEKDPYKIWLSEIILQQTRAEQGLPYYLKFIEAYPTVSDLANANEEAVFRLWQGLGYYNRCKNLLTTARIIVDEFEGVFPKTHEEILKLKGVGAYTAAAIASFAYNLPHAVVDGNVHRVLSRFFGIEIAIDSTEGKKYFSALAQELLDKKNSAAYNQAIMDLGATVCKPQKPICADCPLKSKCFAFEKEVIDELPVKSKAIQVKTRDFNYYILQCGEKVFIQKRLEKDIWQNLYEPFLIEGSEQNARPTFLSKTQPKEIGHSKQRLTHQIIEAKFFLLIIKKEEKLSDTGCWVHKKDLRNFAFPKTVVAFFEKIQLLLND